MSDQMQRGASASRSGSSKAAFLAPFCVVLLLTVGAVWCTTLSAVGRCQLTLKRGSRRGPDGQGAWDAHGTSPCCSEKVAFIRSYLVHIVLTPF